VPVRRFLLLVAGAVAITGLLTGCTSHTTTCSGTTCTVNLTGAQSIDIDPGGGVERDLQVGPIEPGAVTVAVYADAARLTPGGAAELSDLRVELVSVSGRDVSLRVDRG
jgi:hypothetical protein